MATHASSNPAARRAFSLHDRLWQSNRYVYPVVSRRSKGISVGINLNPDKVCNFDCIYCSVDRTASARPNPNPNLDPDPDPAGAIDLPALRAELQSMLSLIHSGNIYYSDPFDKIPPELRRLNDIAFSGDGEPTTCPQFDAAVRLAADVSDQWTLTTGHARPKLVLITNGTMFHRPAVRETLAFLDQHHGEIWAKLDAGTDAYYHLVDRTSIPFQRVLDNLLWCCQTRPTVIQTLMMKVHGNPPSPEEIAAYAARLQHILAHDGTIKLVQLYTVARRTTETYAAALSANDLEHISRHVAHQIPTVPIEIYP